MAPARHSCAVRAVLGAWLALGLVACHGGTGVPASGIKLFPGDEGSTELDAPTRQSDGAWVTEGGRRYWETSAGERVRGLHQIDGKLYLDRKSVV